MLKTICVVACSCMLIFSGDAAAQRGAQGAGKGTPPSEEWRALFREATDLFFQGKFDSGVVVAKKALELAERERGPDHPSVAASLNRLAEHYRALGQFAVAEPLYRRSLAIRENARIPDQPGLGQALNNLAQLYWRKAGMQRPSPSSSAPWQYGRRRAGRITRTSARRSTAWPSSTASRAGSPRRSRSTGARCRSGKKRSARRRSRREPSTSSRSRSAAWRPSRAGRAGSKRPRRCTSARSRSSTTRATAIIR